jgi:hypothetical protein
MTASVSSRSAAGRRGSRVFEVLAVVLLGVATVGSAWCGYQASRWNGEESDHARDASDLEVEAAREFGLATQIVSYDSNMVAQYARAVVDGDETLQAFYRNSLMRPEFLPVLDQWQAQAETSDSPTNLFEDEEYIEGQLVEYRATTAAAEAVSAEGDEAGATADDYVLTTLLLASALFFAGITTSFRVRFAQLLLLVGAAVTIAYAASRLAELPVA